MGSTILVLGDALVVRQSGDIYGMVATIVEVRLGPSRRHALSNWHEVIHG